MTPHHPNVTTPLSGKETKKETEYNVPTYIRVGIGGVLALTSLYAGHSMTNTNNTIVTGVPDTAFLRSFEVDVNANANVESNNGQDTLQKIVVNNQCSSDVYFLESPADRLIKAGETKEYTRPDQIHTVLGGRFSFAKWDCFGFNEKGGGGLTCDDDHMALIELNNIAGKSVLEIGKQITSHWNFNAQTGFINLNMKVLVTTMDDEPSCESPGGSYNYRFSDCEKFGGQFSPEKNPAKGDGYCKPPGDGTPESKLCLTQGATTAGRAWQKELRDRTFTISDNTVDYPNCLPDVVARGTSGSEGGHTQGCANQDASFFCNPQSDPWPGVGFLFGCHKPRQKITIDLTCGESGGGGGGGGGNCASWCHGDWVNRNAGRHCDPVDMGDKCGGCDYCESACTPEGGDVFFHSGPEGKLACCAGLHENNEGGPIRCRQ